MPSYKFLFSSWNMEKSSRSTGYSVCVVWSHMWIIRETWRDSLAQKAFLRQWDQNRNHTGPVQETNRCLKCGYHIKTISHICTKMSSDYSMLFLVWFWSLWRLITLTIYNASLTCPFLIGLSNCSSHYVRLLATYYILYISQSKVTSKLQSLIYQWPYHW